MARCVRHALKDVLVNSIEAYSDPVQSRFEKRFCVSFEEHAIGGHGNIEVRPFAPQHANQFCDVLS